jgi:ankyrin repeat protein
MFRLPPKNSESISDRLLARLLKEKPSLIHQRVLFEGGNYFRHPGLLEFIAENPIRHGSLPANIVDVAVVLLEAGAERSAINDTLGLVASGRVPRECKVQLALLEVLCRYGADPNSGLETAIVHGEFDAVNELIRLGAQPGLSVVAGMGDSEEFYRQLPASDATERHSALALAAQFGHAEIVGALLNTGEDPNRYNPEHKHSHSTPLHQAAFAGDLDTVRLLLEHGAKLDIRDRLWNGTAEDWAEYAGQREVERFLRGHSSVGD